MLVPVGNLAFQAVVTFVVDNFTRRFNGGNLALVGTRLAGFSALVAPAQPEFQRHPYRQPKRITAISKNSIAR